MKQSIGYTVSLNIVIVFIVIVFAFIGGALSYYKAFKINNIIADSIEKYEGYNEYSKKEIAQRLSSLGYNQSSVDCGKHKVKINQGVSADVEAEEGSGSGYCIYYNAISFTYKSVKSDESGSGYKKYVESYNYIVKTYLHFNLPIVNKWLKFPIYTKTNSIYACYGDNCEGENYE